MPTRGGYPAGGPRHSARFSSRAELPPTIALSDCDGLETRAQCGIRVMSFCGPKTTGRVTEVTMASDLRGTTFIPRGKHLPLRRRRCGANRFDNRLGFMVAAI